MNKTAGNVIGLKGSGGHGNVLTGTRHMVSAGHYTAAHAGFTVLEAGGNAIDAGVAAGLALGVTCCDLVNVAGVSPIMIRLAATGEVVTVDGLGVWPRKASSEYFRKHHNGAIPSGLKRAVVPGSPSGWIVALEKWGTMSFGEVAAAAIRLARDGCATGVSPRTPGSIFQAASRPCPAISSASLIWPARCSIWSTRRKRPQQSTAASLA